MSANPSLVGRPPRVLSGQSGDGRQPTNRAHDWRRDQSEPLPTRREPTSSAEAQPAPLQVQLSESRFATERWVRALALLWLGLIIVCAVVTLWPVHGVAGSGAATTSGARSADGPTRAEAVAVARQHSPTVAQTADRVSEVRALMGQLEQHLAAIRTAAYQQNTEVLPLAVGGVLARTRTQSYAAAAAEALTVRLRTAKQDLAVAEVQQQQALAEYFTALAAVAREAELIAADRTVSTVAVESGGTSVGSCDGEVACFLACTRAHESDTAGGYRAVSPDGVYRGAYQFDQVTWNSVAASVGRSDLVGVNPASASEPDQDTLATALYEMRGNQPWGGRC
jgi:hypothetical protein